MFILVFSACAPVPQTEYDYGFALIDIEFEFYSRDEGIYPSTITLQNPNNPFRERSTDKWLIENSGFPSAAFYSWTTNLAYEPIGENQFYTAKSLETLYRSGKYRDEHYALWEMSIAGYQSVLDNFSDSFSYTEDLVAFPLAPLAFDSIVNLGGVVSGWSKVNDENGNPQIIPVAVPAEAEDVSEDTGI